jgi:hypothetical protein
MMRAAGLVILLALTACARPAAEPPARPLLSEPLAPDSLGYSLSLSQVVASQYDGQTQSLRVEVEVSPEKLVMVGVSHLGVPLFSLELDGSGLRTQSHAGEQLPFDPRYILSDFQLAHWPFELVARDLARRGFRLARGLRPGGRYVYDSARELVASIEDLRDGKKAGFMVIQHYDLPYKLLIETLDRSEGT